MFATENIGFVNRMRKSDVCKAREKGYVSKKWRHDTVSDPKYRRFGAFDCHIGLESEWWILLHCRRIMCSAMELRGKNRVGGG